MVFLLSMGFVLYQQYSELLLAIIDLTDAGDELKEIIHSYQNRTIQYVVGLFLIYTFTIWTVGVFYTHRLVGPTVAFQHFLEKIREGDYSARVHVRKNDAFGDIADDLNKTAEELERRHGDAKPS